MNWVIVTIGNDGEITVLGIFDEESSADQYLIDAQGSSMLPELVFVRPVMAARPIEGK